mgnify:CR=1 FL=1|tara:strand:- start:80 stop:1411 length:1332 start_codon:yes stop_codon:yes gene_type:complete
MNAREDYIAKMNTPPPGSYGGGEDFGSPFAGNNSPPGTSNEGNVPYGGNPPSSGGNNNNNNNNNNNQTGSGATGGTGTTGGTGPAGSGITNLAGITAAQKFLGTRQPGLDGLIQDNLETYGLTGKQNINDLTQLDPPNIDTDNSNIINQIRQIGQNLENKYNDLRTFDVGGGQLQINPDIEGGFENPGFEYSKDFMGGNLTGGLNYNTGTNDAKGFLGYEKSFNDGGPVGIMSLPEGYAAGGPVGVDPSDWRIIQQIIASGGNPEDYINYADGGDVNSEGTSYIDPTADNYFLRQFGQYLKRFLPRYDPEQDEYRHKKNREKKQGYENGGEVYDPYNPGPMTAETPMERKPFGGTRENVMDQIEAFDNAPVHIEEPMVGMYGERVPLTLARRVQKYMEGLDPVKRNMIQETLNMFQMKKRMQEMEELNENSGFFGPIPNEYEA